MSESEKLCPAQVEWKGPTIVSTQFNDIYFSNQDAIAESRFVFIQHNKLSQRWAQDDDSTKNSFVIAETGFGTGLNFLNAWQAWLDFNSNKQAPSNKQLHFISFEKHPLTLQDLEKSLSFFPELKEQSKQLIKQYPLLTPGFHQIHFPKDDIHLTLIFGDATKQLSQLDAKINCWFFDGFSPSENESLWSEELFAQVKRLSIKDSSFTTFTSAGHVRRKLQSIGFQCEKVKGFGKKREMLIGRYKPSNESHSPSTFTASERPWFKTSRTSARREGKRALVIGAGLAGCWTAYKLAQRGWQVDIHDKQKEIADGASGNPRAALYVKLNLQADEESLFSSSSFLYCVRALSLFAEQHPGQTFWDQCGVLQLSYNEKELRKHKLVRDSDTTNSSNQIFQAVNDKQASKIAGIEISHPALHIPLAGSVNPKLLCESLIKASSNISCYFESEVDSLNFNEQDKNWTASTNDKADITADIVVIANSFDAAKFTQTQDLPLHQVRGQCSLLQATEKSQKLNTVLSSNVFASPAYNNSHCVGATFDPRDKNPKNCAEDDEQNIAALQHHTPSFYTALQTQNKVGLSDARTAFRCQSSDYIPIVGQVPVKESFLKDYQGLRKGQLKNQYPVGQYYPNLYVNLAHGSKGVCSTPLCAETLCRLINDEPQAQSREIIESLQPGRFYIRELKKNLQYY